VLGPLTQPSFATILRLAPTSVPIGVIGRRWPCGCDGCRTGLGTNAAIARCRAIGAQRSPLPPGEHPAGTPTRSPLSMPRGRGFFFRLRLDVGYSLRDHTPSLRARCVGTRSIIAPSRRPAPSAPQPSLPAGRRQGPRSPSRPVGSGVLAFGKRPPVVPSAMIASNVQPMTLGNMRANGIRSLLITMKRYCPSSTIPTTCRCRPLRHASCALGAV
jgi:hypothetical protein